VGGGASPFWRKVSKAERREEKEEEEKIDQGKQTFARTSRRF
jgi:hypothetical protein